MTISTLEIFQEVLSELNGAIGKAFQADSVNTGSVTKLSEWGVASYGPYVQEGLFVWRYNQTGNNQLKRISRLDPETGTAFVNGNYTDARTDKDLMILN